MGLGSEDDLEADSASFPSDAAEQVEWDMRNDVRNSWFQSTPVSHQSALDQAPPILADDKFDSDLGILLGPTLDKGKGRTILGD